MGTLRTEARECLESEDCSPYDCGCTGGELESVWVIVEDARHRTVARMHLWASYADYQIVPVDLIDGPGDELLIFRIPNHASPPIGFDVKIWKVGRRKAVELGSPERVAAHMPTYPFSCALYRTFFTVDMASGQTSSDCVEDRVRIERGLRLRRGNRSQRDCARRTTFD